MKEYIDLVKKIKTEGVVKSDRTGTGTKSIFGHQMRFDLSKGFPLVTTKKTHMKSIIHELLWFLKGDTNIRYLKENGVSIWDEWSDEDGELGPVYGKQWRFWGKPNGETVDQISQVIETLKTNPDSRRIIVSAWNVGEIDEMALPPCHAFFQFYTELRLWGDVLDDIIDSNIEIGGVGIFDQFQKETIHLRSETEQEGWIDPVGLGSGYRHPDYYDVCYAFAEKHGIITRKLSCQLYMRSMDVFLGTPFNIASYALLTMMIAQVTKTTPGEFILTGGDCHLYSNHMEQVEELLTRKPYPLPTMRLNPEVKDIFDFKYEDFELTNYQCHPAIKAPVAV